MKGPIVYYWDASMFLAFFKKEKGRYDACEQYLTAARGGQIILVTSSFTVVEVLHIQGREKLKSATEELIEEFFRQPYIELIDATRMICSEARRLIWRNPSLKPKDATHLASALYGMRTQPHEVHSFDPDFTKLSQKLGGTPPLRIIMPVANPTLFTEPVAYGVPPVSEVTDVHADLEEFLGANKPVRRKKLPLTEPQAARVRKKKAEASQRFV